MSNVVSSCSTPENLRKNIFDAWNLWKISEFLGEDLHVFFFGNLLKFAENLQKFWAMSFCFENTFALRLWSLALASRGSVLGRCVVGLGLEFFCVLGLGLEPCVLDSTYAKNKKTKTIRKHIHITIVTPLNRYFCQKKKQTNFRQRHKIPENRKNSLQSKVDW